MPAPVRVGHGTTISFTVSMFAPEVKTIAFANSSRDPIDTTHLSSPAGSATEMGGRTSLPSPIAAPGDVALGFHLDPDEIIPINADPEPIEVEFPLQAGELTAAKWTFTGYIKSWDSDVETEDVIQGTAMVEITGVITVVPATTS